MSPEVFKKQIDRIRSQWANAYGEERLKRIWATYGKSVSDDLFEEMVDMALDTMRSAPLADDFAKFEIECAKRRASSRVYDGLGATGFSGVMRDAAKNNKAADPEFVKLCVKLWNDKVTGKVNHKQFLEGCDALDQYARQLNPPGTRSPKEYAPYKD